MSIADFFRRECTIELDGRRYTCRPPSLETVTHLLLSYRDEFRIVAESVIAGLPAGGDLTETIVDLVAIDDVRLARVLTTCVDGPGGVVPRHARTLATVVLSLCDVRRLAAAVDVRTLAAPPSEGETREATDVLAKAIVRMAAAFGATPFDVVRWPMDAYLTIADALVEGGSQSAILTAASAAGIPGVGVHEA